MDKPVAKSGDSDATPTLHWTPSTSLSLTCAATTTTVKLSNSQEMGDFFMINFFSGSVFVFCVTSIAANCYILYRLRPYVVRN